MSDFSLLITNWYRLNKRNLPWRSTTDPYLIWISEIILQQTRVEQGLSYYKKFARNYPTVIDLANAQEIDLLNDWQGLGYYSRARNLHFSAQLIRDEYRGVFPTNYDEIIKLKGVGSYTAAAISSFAFNEPRAVVDGNVYRLLSRCFNIDLAIDSSKGIKYFQLLANELLDKDTPGNHNQAIMEFGSTICSPKPKCTECVLSHRCEALQNNTIQQRPVKAKKTKVRDQFFHFMIYTVDGETIIQKRTQKGIWQNMYQFPALIFDHKNESELKAIRKRQRSESNEIIHVLSHQKIHAIFHHIDGFPANIPNDWITIPIGDLQNYPIPRLIDRYLELIDL